MNINQKEREALGQAKQLIEQVIERVKNGLGKKERDELKKIKQQVVQLKSGLSNKELEALEQAKQLIEQVKERIQNS